MIRKYSILWFAKELGTIAVCLSVIAAMGLGDAPPEREYAEPVEPVRYIPEEPTVQDQIVNACKESGVDPEIAVAIARLETGHFTSAAFVEGNNVGGLSVNETPLSYATLEEGIAAFVDNLAWYQADGLDTVEEIGKRWCPVNYENWVSLVNQIMEEGYV